jgi:hypothetical protein
MPRLPHNPNRWLSPDAAAAALSQSLTNRKTALDAADRLNDQSTRAAWQRQTLREEERAAWLSAHHARAVMLGAQLGVGPLRASDAYPQFVHELANDQVLSAFRNRLVDHPAVYRPVGARGPASLSNTVVTVEPYLTASDIPKLMPAWLERLAARGLYVEELPRGWRIHAPWIADSHLFAIYRPPIN